MNKKIRLRILVGLLILTLGLFYFPFRQPQVPKTPRGIAWFNFDQKDSLKGWEEKIFKGRVEYSVKTDGRSGYLRAYSNKAASGLLRWVKFNPRQHPMVSWQWKVVKFPENKQNAYLGNSWLEKDDYAARFYVIFPKFPFFRLNCLEYVWDKNLPAGTVLTSPYFKNLKVIVAESGTNNLNQWVKIERDIYEDFKKCFGKTPTNVGAIAIMTDADNSNSTAEAQYKSIEVGYAK